ncbi:PREDICTED: uncharacterized protein LOC105365381 [Ceratosolen solmsi marchali]|uniref:Uncharacterized protein LOC105365381 n=1 Tax=Ceratosolen solmsi marchali TaxID=326594 RepID=A0AAJ7DZ79_9HYME|nr:PREDICTED: uncharacterized protein LOC105365381 [Ceratosolen solmsi marchali]
MFYSVDLLRIRKNKKGRIPACWLAATIKEFVGIGIHKLSKADLERLDVEAACCDIFDGITGNEISNRFSLYLSSQLTFGLLKIFRQQVINVEEACQQLYTSILTNSTMSKKEISSKKPVGKTIGAVKDVEMETVDLTCLFPENEVDKHLIQEELPMKTLSSTSNPSELARSPITPLTARRSIFKAHDMSFIMDADPGISGCVPMNEEAAHSLSNAIEPGAEEQARISVRFSIPTGTADQLLAEQNVDEIIAPPQISDESFTGLSTSDASFGRLQKIAKRLKTPQSKDKSGLRQAAPR